MLYAKVMTHTQENATAEKVESRPFNEAERTRFHNLLKLAAESPFEGERDSALAAAERMATRHGMSLDEAAMGGPVPDVPKKRPSARRAEKDKARDVARHIHLVDNWVSNDKARRDAALAEAYERGLDSDQNKRAPTQAPRRNGSKRNPRSHAQVLLRETSLPIDEICSLTGLDTYEVVAMKLKLRSGKSS